MSKKSMKKRKARKRKPNKGITSKMPVGLTKATCYGCNETKPCITHTTLNDTGSLCVPCTKQFVVDVTKFFKSNTKIEGVLEKAAAMRKEAVELEAAVGYGAHRLCQHCGELDDMCECDDCDEDDEDDEDYDY